MTDTAPLGLRPLTVSQERDTPKVSRSFSLFLSLRPRAWSRGKQSKNRLLRLRQLTDPRLPTAGRQRHIILNKNEGRTRSFNQGELVKRTNVLPCIEFSRNARTQYLRLLEFLEITPGAVSGHARFTSRWGLSLESGGQGSRLWLPCWRATKINVI